MRSLLLMTNEFLKLAQKFFRNFFDFTFGMKIGSYGGGGVSRELSIRGSSLIQICCIKPTLHLENNNTWVLLQHPLPKTITRIHYHHKIPIIRSSTDNSLNNLSTISFF